MSSTDHCTCNHTEEQCKQNNCTCCGHWRLFEAPIFGAKE